MDVTVWVERIRIDKSAVTWADIVNSASRITSRSRADSATMMVGWQHGNVTSANAKHTLPSDVLLSFSLHCPLAALVMRPDSLLRLWHYINLLLTYIQCHHRQRLNEWELGIVITEWVEIWAANFATQHKSGLIVTCKWVLCSCNDFHAEYTRKLLSSKPWHKMLKFLQILPPWLPRLLPRPELV